MARCDKCPKVVECRWHNSSNASPCPGIEELEALLSQVAEALRDLLEPSGAAYQHKATGNARKALAAYDTIMAHR